jgi:phytol kinase
MLDNAWLALLLTLLLAVGWLRLMDFFAHRGWISGPVSRKIIHMGTGPLFVICWLLFPEAPESRWLAALVPLMITVQFILVGLRVMKDDAAVKAMSRTGDPKEILRGPLYYGIVFIVITILYWHDRPDGIIALMLLCGGDGIADLLGKRINSSRLPWSSRKTWAGTLSMFLGGWLVSIVIIWIYLAAGRFAGGMEVYLLSITIIAAACTLVESLPFKDIDNLTVPVTAVFIGSLLLI